ncbi:MAG: metallopeptidase TldD-related protein [Bacteroides sp.]|nr:metallopeptidase TldD-related protein [Bacteroides sp.]
MEKEKLICKIQSAALNVTANKVDSYRKNLETLNTIRVYDGGNIGVAGSLGELDETALEEAAKKALSYGIKYPCNLSSNVKTLDTHREIIPQKEFISSIQGLLDRISKECPKFAVSDKIKLTDIITSYENSRGSALLSSVSYMSLGLIFQDKGSGNLFDADYGATLSEYDEDKVFADIKSIYDAFYERVDIEDGEYPVFIVPDEFFPRISAHFNATMYASGGSLLSGKIGESVFNENLTLCDNRDPADDPSACFFDDEGEFAPDFSQPIVKDGALTNVFTNKMYTEMLKVPAAATAGSEYDGVPGITHNGVYLKPTAEKASDIADGRAVLVMIASGGDMTPGGHFATPVQLAFLVENGEIKGRLPELNISGEFFELLGKNYAGAVKNAFFPSKGCTYMACIMKVTKQS